MSMIISVYLLTKTPVIRKEHFQACFKDKNDLYKNPCPVESSGGVYGTTVPLVTSNEELVTNNCNDFVSSYGYQLTNTPVVL
jgi:hypothetical protein